MSKQKLITMDCVQVGDWLIKPSQMFSHIMVTMFNMDSCEFVLQYVKDTMEANLLIEYIIEKGGFND